MDDKLRDKMRARLEIMVEGIDDCLVEQPVFFYDVASAYADAVAQRDALLLDLKEVTAELDQQLRKKYDVEERKVTEAALDKHLRTLPRIQKLARDALQLSAEAEKWLALKEAYQQRSFMLRELVARQIAELNNLGLERTVKQSPRSDLADARHEATSRLRLRPRT